MSGACVVSFGLTFLNGEGGFTPFRRLEEAAICRSDSVESCRSLQSALSAAYFENTLGEAMAACRNTTDIDLSPPTDVYAASAACVTTLMADLTAALMENEVAGLVCSAVAEFRDCPKELPGLSLAYILGDLADMVNTVAPPDFCLLALQQANPPGQWASGAGRAFFLLCVVSLITRLSVVAAAAVSLRWKLECSSPMIGEGGGGGGDTGWGWGGGVGAQHMCDVIIIYVYIHYRGVAHFRDLAEEKLICSSHRSVLALDC